MRLLHHGRPDPPQEGPEPEPAPRPAGNGATVRKPARSKPAKRRWRRRLAYIALAVAVLAALESLPGAFGHDQSALLSEILVSDVTAAAAHIGPFAHDDSSQPCASLESTFGVGNSLFKNRRFGFYASVWPSYQALDAMYVSSLFPGRSACSTAFGDTITAIDTNYWDSSWPHSPGAFDQGPAAFHLRSDLPRVDDSLWMGLAIMQQYARTGAPALLGRAEQVFRLALDNWTPSGGIYWEATGTNNQAKAVVSNAPAAILGIELFRETGDHHYLAWSERIVDWIDTHLADPATGLYNDNIDDHGGRNRIGRAKYTYTQGAMVGLLALLSTVDPTRYPLVAAVDLADRSMAYFDAHHSYGQPGFDVIWADNILWAAALYNHETFTGAAETAVRQALAAEPTGQNDLLTSASEKALRELTVLPSSEYGELLYTSRSSTHGHGG